MAKFHNGPHGPAPCTATKRACPVGGEHYASQEEAQAAYAETMEDGGSYLGGVSRSSLQGAPESTRDLSTVATTPEAVELSSGDLAALYESSSRPSWEGPSQEVALGSGYYAVAREGNGGRPGSLELFRYASSSVGSFRKSVVSFPLGESGGDGVSARSFESVKGPLNLPELEKFSEDTLAREEAYRVSYEAQALRREEEERGALVAAEASRREAAAKWQAEHPVKSFMMRAAMSFASGARSAFTQLPLVGRRVRTGREPVYAVDQLGRRNPTANGGRPIGFVNTYEREQLSSQEVTLRRVHNALDEAKDRWAMKAATERIGLEDKTVGASLRSLFNEYRTPGSTRFTLPQPAEPPLAPPRERRSSVSYSDYLTSRGASQSTFENYAPTPA